MNGSVGFAGRKWAALVMGDVAALELSLPLLREEKINWSSAGCGIGTQKRPETFIIEMYWAKLRS